VVIWYIDLAVAARPLGGRQDAAHFVACRGHVIIVLSASEIPGMRLVWQLLADNVAAKLGGVAEGQVRWPA